MRKWYHAETNEDLRYVITQLQDAVDELGDMLHYHVQNELTEERPTAPQRYGGEDCEMLYRGWAETVMLRARCERLAAVANAVIANHFWAPSVGKALDNLEDGDLFPTKPA